MIKLIALDLDGTVVDGRLNIAPRILDILKRVQTETEIKLVIATGRMFPSTLPFVRRLDVGGPVITYQGP